MARKYFRQDAPIGKTPLVQAVTGDPTAHAMVVRAVLEDPPSETHLEQFKIFASGLAAGSYLAAYDRSPGVALVWTYLRLRPGVPADAVLAGLPAFGARHYPAPIAANFRLEPITDLHSAGDARAVDAAIAAVGALIILVAAGRLLGRRSLVAGLCLSSEPAALAVSLRIRPRGADRARDGRGPCLARGKRKTGRRAPMRVGAPVSAPPRAASQRAADCKPPDILGAEGVNFGTKNA